MRMSSSFLVLFCNQCGYEEEIHFKETVRKGLRCPECNSYIDYEESGLDDIEDWDDILDEEFLDDL